MRYWKPKDTSTGAHLAHLTAESISPAGKAPRARGKAAALDAAPVTSSAQLFTPQVFYYCCLPPKACKWKAAPSKQEAVLGVPESTVDKGPRVWLWMPLEPVPSARHRDQGPQGKQTTSRIKSVCVQHFRSFVHSSLELPALEAATCSLLPLYLPAQTWRKGTNHDGSWPLSELSLGDATAVTPANPSNLA